MHVTLDFTIILERTFWEIRRAFYSFRRGPALAVLLMQIPVLAFVASKGAGSFYLDMTGIMVFILLVSWILCSAVHGNRKILIYMLMLLTVGTMLQCIFIKEAMLKYLDGLKNSSGVTEISGATGTSGLSGFSGVFPLQLEYLLGLAASVIVSAVYYKWDKISTMKMCRILFLISMGISLFTILFSRAVGGAKNWIRIGGLSVQITEINKLIYIFLAAGLLGSAESPSGRRIHAFCFVTGLEAVMLILQGEYGTLLLLTFVFFAYLFLFVPEIKVFIKTAAVFGCGMMAAIYGGYQLNKLADGHKRLADNLFIRHFLKAYSKIASRFIYWAHPDQDPLGLGYQLLKAKESIVLGGWFGTASVTELPVKTSDLVYPALIQRCGMIFALLVFMIFIMMWLEGMRLTVRKTDRYHQAVACGIVTMLFMQTLIIIAGSTGLCPLTGITLPFISSGGSSLLISFIMIGLLITISGNVRWKGCSHEETEDFFKESVNIAKHFAGLCHLDHFVPGSYLRTAAGRLKRGRSGEGKSDADHV